MESLFVLISGFLRGVVGGWLDFLEFLDTKIIVYFVFYQLFKQHQPCQFV